MWDENEISNILCTCGFNMAWIFALLTIFLHEVYVKLPLVRSKVNSMAADPVAVACAPALVTYGATTAVAYRLCKASC